LYQNTFSFYLNQVKTRVLRKTTSPVYDEIFTFYGIDYNQLQGITLHFVVLSFDRFSRDDIIGEVLWSLSGVDLSEREVTLCREISPRHIKVREWGTREGEDNGVGEVRRCTGQS
jgi:hypothetical protein